MLPKDRTFVAANAHAGLTVLAVIRQWLPGTSWSAVRQRLAARQIAVNQLLCLNETRRIEPGDVITLAAHEFRPPPTASEVQLVWLDADVVVVDKPAGMITLRHFAERTWSARKKSLQPALDDVLPQLVTRGEKSASGRSVGTPRIDAVHRIDRGTSGLLVFALNSQARDCLMGQFRQHTVERKYVAVAAGAVAGGTFESYFVKDRGDGRRGSTQVTATGKRAVTHVQPIERLDGFTLLECRLETGRTHQIRIHLSEAGHPIYGDGTYGNVADDPVVLRSFPRLALHAATLGFDHPKDGRRIRFESPLPTELVSLIERLR